MADVAVVFHWPPQAMDEMPLSDLMLWRTKAAERSKPTETKRK
ncbi:GpE family phage tail protein [Sphingomonas cavernae]|uniref:GpE family phage tail protein n=1 Tax=Sphingomonas cavernae TaxID=2320861 RepID=A0A418WP43_9SPHN|nr:GpE family phage tail protein [Sphingomonas cavernae]RJF92995.1 GpE family phage tail protein [Sphingomonas cavernae]